MSPTKFKLALLVLCAIAGCGTDADTRPAEWAYIAPLILVPNCATASCHSKGAAVSGLDMSTPDSAYHALLGQSIALLDSNDGTPVNDSRPECYMSGANVFCDRPRLLVTPCNPSQSRIVRMMRADGAPRMPPDRPIAEADIALIERWILAGARQHPDDDDPCAVNATPGMVDGGTP